MASKPTRKILLNPGPATTTDRVKQALIQADICPREADFGRLALRVAKKLAEVVQGGPDYNAVLLPGSGTAGVEAALTSLLPAQGKLLILDNGAYGKRAEEIAQAYRLPHLTHRLGWGDYPDLEALDQLMAQNPDLSHFFFVHHETTTGMLNPLEGLVGLCHKHGLVSIVDAMSSFAGLPIQMKQTGVDFLVSSSNKCIQGFAGLSFVISRQSLLEASRAFPQRNYYLNLWASHQHLEGSGQFRFTPPVQILYALDEALEEFFEETQTGRTQRYVKCYQTLLAGLKQVGFQCLLPSEQHSKLLTAIVEPKHPGYDFNHLHDYLYERDITIYPGKGAKQNTFRIANIGAIDHRDMEAFNRHLLDWCRLRGLV